MSPTSKLCIACLLVAIGCSCRSGGDGAAGTPASSQAEGRQLADGSSEGVVTVQVKGVRNDTGEILVSLFESAEGFPSEHATAELRARCPASEGEIVLDLAPLGAGRYAIAVLHDENANEKADTGFLGVPTEGTGVSNNPAARMGPPRFEEALFDFDGDALMLEISLRYLMSE